jgi:cation diffusion facilitator family transporter
MSAHQHDLSPFEHAHRFADDAHPRRERALWWVTVITLVTMVLELAVGYWSGSLALTADGWHMGTHAGALGAAALAMHLARRARGHSSFAFGGWKIEMLAAYTSGLGLLLMAAWIFIEAVAALRAPREIAYVQAMAVAAVGLLVNIACAVVLQRSGMAHEHAHGHDHDHGHGHGHAHAHHHHDTNFRAAYLHVLADAMTSVSAIVALALGLALGWRWLDPVVAMVAAFVIAHWSLGVLRESVRALVDATSGDALRERIRCAIECDDDAKVADLHAWQVGPQAWAAVVSIVADRPHSPQQYRQRLDTVPELRHVTVEVHRCQGGA